MVREPLSHFYCFPLYSALAPPVCPSLQAATIVDLQCAETALAMSSVCLCCFHAEAAPIGRSGRVYTGFPACLQPASAFPLLDTIPPRSLLWLLQLYHFYLSSCFCIGCLHYFHLSSYSRFCFYFDAPSEQTVLDRHFLSTTTTTTNTHRHHRRYVQSGRFFHPLQRGLHLDPLHSLPGALHYLSWRRFRLFLDL
jgi:hypothetical protein